MSYVYKDKDQFLVEKGDRFMKNLSLGERIDTRDIVTSISLLGLALSFLMRSILPETFKSLMGLLVLMFLFLLLITLIFKLELIPLLLENVSRIFGIQKDDHFIHNEKQGTLLYGKKRIRNVAIRLESISKLLDGLLIGIPTQEKHKRFRDAGIEVANNFSQDFMDEILEEKKEYNGKELLSLWAKYDSDVGWGAFNFDLSETDLIGMVTIKNTFLCYKKRPKDIARCGFLEGYIEGMLNNIFEKSVKVKYNSCKRGICKFDVRESS